MSNNRNNKMNPAFKQQLLVEKDSLIRKLVAVCNVLDNMSKEPRSSVPERPSPTEEYILLVLREFLSEKPKQPSQICSEIYKRGYACHVYKVRKVLKKYPNEFKRLGPNMGWIKSNQEYLT